MIRARVHTFACMGTTVTFRAPGVAVASVGGTATEDAFRGAEAWFREVEGVCNRFDPDSELCRLSARIGVPAAASPLLFHAVEFALALAEKTGGAFDPTVGQRMEGRGFDRSYLTGERVRIAVAAAYSASYRDVHLDPVARTITLARPLLLDLGATAKGLAIDLAARELACLGSFVIDAGGDLWMEGLGDDGVPWTAGIRDPFGSPDPIELLGVAGPAVCTSGDYERRGDNGESHLIDPRTPESALEVSSVTVTGPSAMVADGMATAVAVLGPEAGLALLEDEGLGGVIYTRRRKRFATGTIARTPALPARSGSATIATAHA